MGLRSNNPDGGLFIVTFLAHNPLIVRTMIIILLGGSNSDVTIPKSNTDDRLGQQKDILLGRSNSETINIHHSRDPKFSLVSMTYFEFYWNVVLVILMWGIHLKLNL